jgi:hypothetical protein
VGRGRGGAAAAKPPFGSPTQVLKYLGRYTHRIAISNHRLLFVGNGVVRFQYYDYAEYVRRGMRMVRIRPQGGGQRP